MKSMTKLIYVFVIVLGLALTQVLAQEALPFGPPTASLIPCQDEAEEAVACDLIATTPEEIAGVWAVYFNAEPAFVRFNADGTWWMAATAEASGEASPDYPSGTFTIDENGVFTTSDPSLSEIPDLEIEDECLEGQYLARVIRMGDQPVALSLAVVADCFPPRRTDYSYAMVWAGE